MKVLVGHKLSYISHELRKKSLKNEGGHMLSI